MEYLEIELDSYGLMFSTAQLYFSLSWLGMGLTVAGIVAYQVIKRYKRKASA